MKHIWTCPACQYDVLMPTLDIANLAILRNFRVEIHCLGGGWHHLEVAADTRLRAPLSIEDEDEDEDEEEEEQ